MGERNFMIDVLLCGDAADASIADALVPALSLCGGLCRSGGGSVDDCGGRVKYFLFESAEVPKIGMKSGILVFKSRLGEAIPAKVPEGFVCVFGSQNTRAADILRGSPATVVTFGTGPKDTLSLAGLDTAAACVSLQRNVATLKGKLLEPHDFSVGLNGKRSPEQVLAVSAVLLLSGEDSESGYRI